MEKSGWKRIPSKKNQAELRCLLNADGPSQRTQFVILSLS